jgi:hypothetical protein
MLVKAISAYSGENRLLWAISGRSDYRCTSQLPHVYSR